MELRDNALKKDAVRREELWPGVPAGV